MTLTEAIDGFQRDVLDLAQKYSLHPALACVLLQNCEHIMRDIAQKADAKETEDANADHPDKRETN